MIEPTARPISEKIREMQAEAAARHAAYAANVQTTFAARQQTQQQAPAPPVPPAS